MFIDAKFEYTMSEEKIDQDKVDIIRSDAERFIADCREREMGRVALTGANEADFQTTYKLSSGYHWLSIAMKDRESELFKTVGDELDQLQHEFESLYSYTLAMHAEQVADDSFEPINELASSPIQVGRSLQPSLRELRELANGHIE